MGAWEIQQRTGWSREWTQRIITRRDFPAPYVTLRMGSIWLRADVEAWIRVHRPHLDDPDEA